MVSFFYVSYIEIGPKLNYDIAPIYTFKGPYFPTAYCHLKGRMMMLFLLMTMLLLMMMLLMMMTDVSAGR